MRLEASGARSRCEEEEEKVRSVLGICLRSERYNEGHKERDQGCASEDFLEQKVGVESTY